MQGRNCALTDSCPLLVFSDVSPARNETAMRVAELYLPPPSLNNTIAAFTRAEDIFIIGHPVASVCIPKFGFFVLERIDLKTLLFWLGIRSLRFLDYLALETEGIRNTSLNVNFLTAQ